MLEHKFQKTQADHRVFVKRYDEGDFLILLLYMDDMLIVGQEDRELEESTRHVILHEGSWTDQAYLRDAHNSR